MSDKFDCGRFVAHRIHNILGDNPSSLRPASRAALAQLRQAAGTEPGTVPAVWSLTFEGLPEQSPQENLRTEWAVHTALTLFAVHQQAQSTSMHVDGQGFGQAVRLLANQTAKEEGPQTSPVYHRFLAVASASTMKSLSYHARSLVTQLRSKSLGFDYAEFANSLYFFQIPSKTKTVQRIWGRQFHYSSINVSEGVSA